jgi:hypothetical protein
LILLLLDENFIRSVAMLNIKNNKKKSFIKIFCHDSELPFFLIIFFPTLYIISRFLNKDLGVNLFLWAKVFASPKIYLS